MHPAHVERRGLLYTKEKWHTGSWFFSFSCVFVSKILQPVGTYRNDLVEKEEMQVLGEMFLVDEMERCLTVSMLDSAATETRPSTFCFYCARRLQ